MVLAITPGQESNSESSKAQQWRIPSEMGRSFDRGRAGCLRFGVGLRGFMACLNGHHRGTRRRQMKLRLGERLHLLNGGIGGEFAEDEALRGDVYEGEFRDNVIDNFDAGERQGAFFQDFLLVVAGGWLSRD